MCENWMKYLCWDTQQTWKEINTFQVAPDPIFKTYNLSRKGETWKVFKHLPGL